MEKYRTFIAVPLRVGEEFLHARAALMERLSGERISWVAPELYHVTLRFLGDTPSELVRTIGNASLEKVECPVREGLDLHQAGSFGPRRKPRVIWVGFKDASLFENLKEEVDRVLESCCIQPVDQPFRAHLTLGRIRSLKDRGAYYHIMDSMKNDFAGKVLAARLVFYRSELGPGGPVYTPIKEMRFKNF